MNLLRRLLQMSPVNRARRTPGEHAEDDARSSAQKYWEREVAAEQKRRGTPDKPRRR